MTGIFTDLGIDQQDQLTFIKTTGPSALARNGRQLTDHGKLQHKDGFSSPVGKLKGIDTAIEDMDIRQLLACGIKPQSVALLMFESGITVTGLVYSITQSKEGKTYLISFKDCTVKESNGNILFQPEWGIYDMAIGEKIVSVFNGAADKDAYEELTHVSDKQTHKIDYDEKALALHLLYKKVRLIREEGEAYEELSGIFHELRSEHRQDWLCALEILEILYHRQVNPELEKEVRLYLQMKASNEKEFNKLINDGLHVIENPVAQLITEED